MRSRAPLTWGLAFVAGAVAAITVFSQFVDDTASPWRLLIGLVVGAVVGAAVFGFVRSFR